MADVKIKGGLTRDNAILLLAAAEAMGVDAGVVRTTVSSFYAPQELADKAGVEYVSNAKPSAKKPDSQAADKVTETESAQPKKAANKAAWVAYAVSKGADHDEADAKSKNDLIADYGTKE